MVGHYSHSVLYNVHTSPHYELVRAIIIIVHNPVYETESTVIETFHKRQSAFSVETLLLWGHTKIHCCFFYFLYYLYFIASSYHCKVIKSTQLKEHDQHCQRWDTRLMY